MQINRKLSLVARLSVDSKISVNGEVIGCVGYVVNPVVAIYV
jgi:hypothetical protein